VSSFSACARVNQFPALVPSTLAPLTERISLTLASGNHPWAAASSASLRTAAKRKLIVRGAKARASRETRYRCIRLRENASPAADAPHQSKNCSTPMRYTRCEVWLGTLLTTSSTSRWRFSSGGSEDGVRTGEASAGRRASSSLIVATLPFGCCLEVTSCDLQAAASPRPIALPRPDAVLATRQGARAADSGPPSPAARLSHDRPDTA
jgi:hypothetical protein